MHKIIINNIKKRVTQLDNQGKGISSDITRQNLNQYYYPRL